jgi:hypothetical protein
MQTSRASAETRTVRVIVATTLIAILALPAAAAATEAPADSPPAIAMLPQARDREQPAVAVRDAPAPRRQITAWLAGGLGWGSIGGQDASLARTELAVGIGRHLVSLSYTYSEDTNGACETGAILCFNDVSLPRNSAKELALRYGVKGRAPFVLGTASIGPAAVWGVQRGSNLLSRDCFFACASQYDARTFRAVGATAEFGGYLSSRFVSFGPTVVIDINAFQSFWAVMVDLHLGYLGSVVLPKLP